MEKVLRTNDLAFFALGGLGEVGKNMYIVQYKNQIFIIDSGILFPDETLFGVDYVMPDFTYLKQNQEKIIGLFITHAHEDHIGGIPFLLKKVRIPKIYANGVAIELINAKLQEHKGLSNITIEKYNEDSIFEFKDIKLSFVRMTHSIPDSFGFVFETKFGKIFHTGDFKMDQTPIGPPCEFHKLAKLGEEGLLALMADSTNATLDGYTQSESKIGKSIKELFATIKSRIIVATFASNIYRVQQIVEASVINKRKICVFGRSMEKTIEIGLKIGYINPPQGTFIEPTDIGNYKPEQITILSTGSQGESLAALSRISQGIHKHVKLIPGDTIIFSSSPIPGNQEYVNKTINNLIKNGCNVITHNPMNDTHTSGHASQGELKYLQAFLRPKYFIPIHGEYRMQRVHADLAIECGVKKENIFILENGDVLSFNEDQAFISGKIQTSDLYVDGQQIGDISPALIRERKTLSEEGMFAIVIPLNIEKKEVITEPQIVSRGFIYMKDSEELTKEILNEAKKFIYREIKKPTFTVDQLKSNLSYHLSKIIYDKTDRKPMIIPIVL